MGQTGMDYFAKQGVTVFDSNNLSPEEELIESASREQVDAIIVRRATITPAVMDASKNLKAIVKVGAGLDSIDIEAATERGIVVCNGAGINAQATAELAFSLVLAVVRGIVPLAQDMKEANWSQNQYRVAGLAGQTFGIVGLGYVGRIVASMARPFGVKLIAYSPNAPEDAFDDDIERISTLEELLKKADVVSVHTPGRPENRHIFNEKAFALMKPTAFFINNGRGSVVDEHALAAALTNGVIAGAGIDVFEPEPPAADNPLLSAPNLVMTPHVSSRTHHVIATTARQAAVTTCRILDGKRPDEKFLVNPEVYERD
ncbi:MAG TPA: 3-phosphoglycerate dehydrogenase [Rhodospirillaceae bacterium]|nr:3-phosphoglycerate dehydrogenase [Rhodospirillaceae bacterium]